jgi:hypothetical protein
MRLVAFSVTTRISPSAPKPTCAGFAPPDADSARVPSASGRNSPWWLRNPATLPAPPALSTYTMPSFSVTLIGRKPPESTTDVSTTPSPRTTNVETVFAAGIDHEHMPSVGAERNGAL